MNRLGRAARASLLAGGGVWAAACASLYWRAFGPLRWGPDAVRGWTPADLQAPHERLDVVTSDGLRLLAWYLPGARDAVVVVSNGYRGRAGDVLGISTALQRAGFNVVAYGWRGTPGSDPAPHTMGVKERLDLAAVIDAIEARLGSRPLGLLGYSLGGSVSLAVAAADPRVAAICVDSAFADPVGVLRDGVRARLRVPGPLLVAPVSRLVALRTGARLAGFRPLEAVAAIAPRPLLIIQGDADPTVKPVNARRLYAAAGEPKELWTVPGVAHVNAYFHDREAYVARVTDFFRRALEPSATE